MWIVHLILCFLTGGLWLIPLSIYYIVKFFTGGVGILDNFLANKYTDKGKTISLAFPKNFLGNYVDSEIDVHGVNPVNGIYNEVKVSIKVRPKEEYKYFYDVYAECEVTIFFKSASSGNELSNVFTYTLLLNNNGVVDYECYETLSAPFDEITKIEANLLSQSGRVVVEPKKDK